jgi:DNA-binding IclR family transcriptional regulator
MGDSAMHDRKLELLLPSGPAAAARTDPAAAPPTGTQSIRRAVAVLREISMYNLKGLRLVDLEAHLGLERSTAHRILQCLVYENLVVEKRPGNRYVLGPLAFELGLAAGKRFNLADLMRPHLRAIAEETGDVAFLCVRSGMETTCIDKVEGSYPVKAYTRNVGDRRPLGFGCVGTAMLAGLGDAEARRILKENRNALRTYADTTPEEALRRTQQARADGYALNERVTHGLRSVAMPVASGEGPPTAVLSICAIASRMRPERLPRLVDSLRRACAAAAVDLAAYQRGEHG